MEKDLKYMSIEEILSKIGIILTPANMYYIINDDRYADEIDQLSEQIKKNPKLNNDLLFKYLRENEGKINKEILVLISLSNYINRRDKIDKQNFQGYYSCELKIEECKSLLENKDVSIFGFSGGDGNERIGRILEVSSIELCAENVYDLDTLSKEDLRIYEKRKNRLVKKNEEIKKKVTKNTERLKQIEEKFDLKNVLQFIILDDFSDILVGDRELGDIIKTKISRNLEKINIEEGKTIGPYTQEMKHTIIENIEYFDLDKILLLGAYRITEFLSMGEYQKEDIKSTKNLLMLIANRLKDKNVKISGEIKDFGTRQYKKVKYDKNILIADIDRFIDDEMYLSNETIRKIKDELLSGNKTLIDYNNPDILDRLDFSVKEFDKIVKMSSENFLIFLDLYDPAQEDINEVLSEIETINSECLYELIKNNKITEEQIIDICVKKKINIEQLVELASLDQIRDEVIIDSYILMSNQENQNTVDTNLLIQYFNIEKVNEYLKENKINEKFAEFYSKILPENETERKEVLDKIHKLFSKVDDKDVLLNFYKFNLITEELLIGKITEEDIINAYETGKINISTINKLYEQRLIDADSMALIIDEEYSEDDILKNLNEGIIDLNIALKLYSDKKFYDVLKKYDNQEFTSPSPAIFAFATSNMTIEEIDELYKKGIVKEKDLVDVLLQGNISKTKITELYVNMLISEEIIDKLNENQIISDYDSELMKKALGMKNIVKNMDKSLGIAFGSQGEIEVDEGIFLPDEKAGNVENRWGVDQFPDDGPSRPPKLKKVISPAIREKKFEMYGAKRIKRHNVEYNEKSPFNDYEFYIIPDKDGNVTPSCIVIAERYYEDKYSCEEKLVDGNATYLFELKDLTRISKKSKPEILEEMKEAKDSRMKRKLHTKNWAKNMDKVIGEFLGVDLKSCYTEKEIHDLETLSNLIDGFKDKGQIYRIFDVEFY